MKKFISHSIDEVLSIAQKISKKISKNKPLLIQGEIGVGKTTLVQKIGQILGEKKNITSPTFNIMKIYDKFIHIDAYKINGNIDHYEEYFKNKIIIIEWPENLKIKFKNFLWIHIKRKKNKVIYIIKKDK